MFNTILVYPIFNLLAVIYAYVHDFGLAIIILTILIRLLLWPLVSRQLHSQKALQELQPELQRIKSEAGGDRQKEGQLTMELYKEREINPFASILPLLIQLPILFAFFAVLRDVVKPGEMAKIAYLPVQHLPAIAALVKSHVAFHPTLLGAIDLTKSSLLLAALAGVVQFIQTKQLQPKQQAKDAQAQMMAGMTYVFPFLTFIIGVRLPSALPLYWIAASLMAVLQQYLVLRQDVRELEDGTPAPAAATPSVPAKAPAPQLPAKRKAGKAKGEKA